MTGPLSASAPGGEAAASASAGTASSPPLVFRRDDDVGFPVAGAVLLFALMAGALALVWYDRRRKSSPGGGWSRLLAPRLGQDSNAGADARLLSTTRIDAGTRLHVIEWQGRQLLVAVQGQAAPVVLDRIEPPAGMPPPPAAKE